MGRYDRSRKKKSKNSTFLIMPLILALMFGILATFFVRSYLKKFRETDKALAESAPSEKTRPEPYRIEGRTLTLNELQPLQPELKTELSLNSLVSNQQDGLPDLLGSDELFRASLIKLSPGLLQWLNTDQLIRRYVVIANDFAQGIRITKHMSFLRFDEPFSVLLGDNVLYIAPKSTRRYDALTQAIKAIDAKAAVAVYKKFRPLMLQVFAEFSYPKDITLESIIKKAAAEILAAPVIEGLVPLVRPSLFYKFADPKLEALNPVQKQMIRMGPENTRIIQLKCREFLVELAKISL